MKFATKLILGTTIIIAILFSLGGSIMIRENFQVSYNNVVEQNTKQHILYRYSVESSIRGLLENNSEITREILIRSMDKLMSYGNRSNLIGLIWNNKLVYSDLDKSFIDEEVKNYYSEENTSYLIKEIGDKMYMYLGSSIKVSNENITLLNVYDISSIFIERERQNDYYIKWFFLIISAYVVSILLFTKILIAPINRLNEISKRIAKGNYKERTSIASTDEIGELSQSFDKMTDSIEEHVNTLEADVKNREAFISNFSHELKTPMTSIMGYSKLLMKESCNVEIQKKSANYIYSECKRLEMLSRKLLQLMEIDEMPIELVSISTDWIKEKINLVMQPLIENKKLLWSNEWESAYIKGDPQLLIDLIKNLIDNGVKASDKDLYISIQGMRIGNKYRISVSDHGCGINDEEIEKIIDPFYMVDKGRAKNQGSSGLGLALCSKIAIAHNTKLEIKSEVSKGTIVSFNLEVEDEEEGKY